QMFNRFRGEWMPVTHGHEAAGVDAGFCQLELQGSGLLFGKPADGRASADDRIMMLNFFGARAGNQLRQRLSAQAGEREVDDIGIAKKIKKERFDCVQRVGAAELEQNYTYSPCWVHHPQSFLAEQRILLKIEKVGQRVASGR